VLIIPVKTNVMDSKGKDLRPMKTMECKYNTAGHKYSDINQKKTPLLSLSPEITDEHKNPSHS
jgi:hypothetical protein